MSGNHADEDGHDDVEPSAPSQPRRCHRIAAVGDVLDISPSSVRRLIQAGQLDVVHINSSVRVTEASLERLLSTGRRRPRRRGKK